MDQDLASLLSSHHSLDVHNALSANDIDTERDDSDSDGISTMAQSGRRRKAKYAELNQLDLYG